MSEASKNGRSAKGSYVIEGGGVLFDLGMKKTCDTGKGSQGIHRQQYILRYDLRFNQAVDYWK